MMFDISHSELKDIDVVLEEKLGWATQRRAEAEQLALDASRLLSCNESRVKDYTDQGFFKRCWHVLSGKTGSLERATQADLISMQKHAWRYINLLQERDLMLAHSMISVKNNLMTLAIDQGGIKREITLLADKVYNRFVALEERVGELEVNQRIHSWLLTIDTCGYDERYPEHIRLIRVIRDFYAIKSSSWNIVELRYLHKALKEVGLDPKKKISVKQFIDGVIDDVNRCGYEELSLLLPSYSGVSEHSDSVVDAVSAPAFGSLYQIKDNYIFSSRVIRSLECQLKSSHEEAIKFVLTDFVDEMGIATNTELPLKDLAIELLSCFSLAERLLTRREEGELCPELENNIAPPQDESLPASASSLEPDEAWLELGNQSTTNLASEKSQPTSVRSLMPIEARLASFKKILERFEVDKGAFYKFGTIPHDKLSNAKASMAIPAEETVIALIDTTLFGSAKDGIAIGVNRLYWKNLLFDPGCMDWEIINAFQRYICQKGIKLDSKKDVVVLPNIKCDPKRGRFSAEAYAKIAKTDFSEIPCTEIQLAGSLVSSQALNKLLRELTENIYQI